MQTGRRRQPAGALQRTHHTITGQRSTVPVSGDSLYLLGCYFAASQSRYSVLQCEIGRQSKIYFLDLGIRNALINDFNNQDNYLGFIWGAEPISAESELLPRV
jgi:hypothetical protein